MREKQQILAMNALLNGLNNVKEWVSDSSSPWLGQLWTSCDWSFRVKRRFRWCLSAVLLYLLSVPIIFILIGLLALLVLIVGVSVGPATAFLWMYIMLFFGIPASLLFSLFAPSIVLGWLRKRRFRRLIRLRRKGP